MKTAPSYIFIVGVLLTFASNAQDPVWIKSYGNGKSLVGHPSAFHLASDAGGNVYAGGGITPPGIMMDNIYVSGPGGNDILLAKLDPTGQTIWAVAAGGNMCMSDAEKVTGIAYDPIAQQVLIIGMYSGPGSFGDQQLTGSCDSFNSFVACYDPGGVCLWVKGMSGMPNRINAILVDGSSDSHIFGHSDLFSQFLEKPVLAIPKGGYHAVYSSDGDLTFAERILRNGEVFDAKKTGTNYILSGIYSGQDSLWLTPLHAAGDENQGFVAMADMNGGVTWVTPFTGDSHVWNSKITVLPSGRVIGFGLSFGDVIIQGDTISVNDAGVLSGFIYCLDPSGMPIWTLPVTSPEFLGIVDLVQANDESLYILGKFSNELNIGPATIQASASKENYIARFDTLGNVLGIQLAGRTQPTSPGSLLADVNGVYVSAPFDSTLTWGSHTLHPNQFNFPDIFLARLDSIHGFMNVMSYKSISSSQLHIYANPNDGTCTIELPQELEWTPGLMLHIHDGQGRLVQSIPLRREQDRVALDIRAQAKGIYPVEVTDGKQRYSGIVVFE